MASDYFEDVIRRLRDAGWTKTQGGKGSHEKWIDASGKRVVVVPRSKSRHTANEVRKQAALPKAFWTAAVPCRPEVTLSLAMKPSSDGKVVPARLAATVLLVRDGPVGLQVFMVVRHRQIEFASGALVFPGGAVDPGDHALAGGDEERAVRVAAIRETYEECGVLLARSRGGGPLAASADPRPFHERLAAEGLTPALDALTLFAHWITPAILPKRFDTRFYIAQAPADQVAIHDGGEAVDSVWIKPARALAEAAEGLRTLVLPTRLNLELLGQSATAAQAMAAAQTRRVTPIEPHTVKTATGHRLTLPADARYSAAVFDV